MRLRSSKMTFSDKEGPDVMTNTLPKQPFRFLDLPKELRFMVYEELMNNEANSIKFTPPKGFDIEYVYLDGMYYPNLLQVNKLVHDEYWSLCLRKSILWITYNCSDPNTSDEDISEADDVGFPRLSEWLKIPTKVLVRITEVVFRFGAMFLLPRINPFSGIADCTEELPSLKLICIWSEMEMDLIDSTLFYAGIEMDMWFEKFVDSIFDEQARFLDVMEATCRDFDMRVDCDLYTPLYEMNKRLRWPRSKHLTQGVAPLAGLPEWGYAFFNVVPEWMHEEEDSFTYHGQELQFSHVERHFPTLERSSYENASSEDGYEFDESGWAID
ncbi:unnamed protein product [Aureobasidium vineae]|uniref:Uncharacterized protein n=1 Tax=Aureobasidium vineae TaxID=2773715 RepID=A0A9N8K2C3_9PEZI|nr:unnamed protein product [Aureobasidium vineae]